MKHFLFVCALLAVFLLCNAFGQITATDSSKTNQLRSEYEKWIAPYKLNSAGRRFSIKETQPKLVITVVTEREPDADAGNHGFLFSNGKFSSGWEISTEGKGEWFSHGSLGSKGSCCSQIEKDKLERFNQLLTTLPDDGSRLPPNGRRLLLQIADGNKFNVRVYDLANAPDEVLELLRLTKTGIRSNVLRFAPQSEWKASEHSVYGGLAVTSDGRQVISSGLNGPIKIWDAESHILIGEVAKPQNVPFNGLILSPDDSIAIINGWGEIGVLDAKTWQASRIIEEPFINRKRHQLSNPQFIKNGKFLLIESAEPALHIYDTKTWKRLIKLPEIPADAISYHPAVSAKRALFQSPDEQIILRDTSRQHNVAVLDKAKIKYVAFSPDESLVAVVTVHPGTGDVWTRYRIRIWKVENGKFVKELLPFERNFCESVEGLMWSSDGKYILAANKADIFFSSRGISVWNLESGRHRGEISGCPANLHGLGFLAEKNKIVAGCGDGVIRVWDFADALDRIRKFETEITDK